MRIIEREIYEPYMKLIVSLLSKRTIEICNKKSDNWEILLGMLYSKVSRLFSGKQHLKLENLPRWIIYALKDIGDKTDWWSVKWLCKRNVNTMGRTLTYGEPILRTKKYGSAIFSVNISIREQLHGQPKGSLVIIYVTEQLKALFPHNNFKLYIPRDVIKLIASYMYPTTLLSVDDKYLCGCSYYSYGFTYLKKTRCSTHTKKKSCMFKSPQYTKM